MHVLHVGRKSPNARLLNMALRRSGFEVTVTDSRQLLDLAQCATHDLIYITINDADDLSILETLQQGTTIPVLALVKDEPELRKSIEGLGVPVANRMEVSCGAQDVATRMRFLVAKSRGIEESTGVVGRMKMYLDSQVVCIDDIPVHLTKKQFSMLKILWKHKEETVTKEMFLDQLYGGIDEPELKIIDVFVCKLRQKLQKASGGPHYIETVWGRGYSLRG